MMFAFTRLSLKNIIFFVFGILLLALGSCKKPKPQDADGPPIDSVTNVGDFVFKVNNTVGGSPIRMMQGTDSGVVYYNANGDDFRIKKLLYYISNLYFLNDTGAYIRVVNEDYFLINQADGIFNSTLLLPEGNYVGMRFLIGVDSIRNVSGIQSGALDPIWGMFWDWNTGYIMAMFEGVSSKAPFNGGLGIHIGGFHGTFSSLRSVHLQFNRPLEVRQNSAPNLTLQADILKWFEGRNLISFDNTYSVASAGTESVKIADNYQQMFISAQVQP